MNRREFFSVMAGIGLLPSIGIPASYIPYRLCLWSKTDTWIQDVMSVIPTYGNYKFLADFNISKHKIWEGAALLRLDGSYVSSKRFGGDIAVINGDKISISYAIAWEPDASRQQWMEKVSKLPKARFGHPASMVGILMLEINDWDLMDLGILKPALAMQNSA